MAPLTFDFILDRSCWSSSPTTTMTMILHAMKHKPPQLQLLLVLALLVGLLLSPLATTAASTTTPRWYQRPPTPPTEAVTGNTQTTTDAKNVSSSTSQPGWLQRAFTAPPSPAAAANNITATGTEPKEASSTGFASFFPFSLGKNSTEARSSQKKPAKPKEETTNSPKPTKEKPSPVPVAPPTSTSIEVAKVDEPETSKEGHPKIGETTFTSPTTKKGWLPFQGSSKKSPTSDETKNENEALIPKVTPTADTSKSKDDTPKKQRKGWRQVWRANTSTNSSKASEAIPTTAPETTATATTNQTVPQQQQEPPQGVMIVGAPPNAYYQYSYRGRPPSQPNPNYPRGGPPMPTSDRNSAVVAELISSVVGTALRLWLFTWLTRQLAAQEERSIPPTQHFSWERLNDRFSRDTVALQNVVREPPLGVSPKAWRRHHVRKVLQGRRRVKQQQRLADVFTRTVVVVELGTGSESASARSSGSCVDLEHMPDVISFLLQQQRSHAFGTCKQTGEAMELEVVFLVNSPGGAVATYGLAAAQLLRLKDQANNISTTVCVDKFAASGGYMIASQADKLVAAPFATIGSVGVILEGLNFYELAKRYGVQPLVIKAGESKNPLSQWGPVTRQDLDQEQGNLAKVHAAFKALVLRGRPGLLTNMKKVTDGSVYLGREAKELGMVDAVMTTDEYILERIEAGDRVLKLHRSQQGRFPRQLRLSPLDLVPAIFPHLRAWASNAMVKLKTDDAAIGFVSRIVQTGTWIGFVNYLLRTYGKLLI